MRHLLLLKPQEPEQPGTAILALRVSLLESEIIREKMKQSMEKRKEVTDDMILFALSGSAIPGSSFTPGTLQLDGPIHFFCCCVCFS